MRITAFNGEQVFSRSRECYNCVTVLLVKENRSKGKGNSLFELEKRIFSIASKASTAGKRINLWVKGLGELLSKKYMSGFFDHFVSLPDPGKQGVNCMKDCSIASWPKGNGNRFLYLQTERIGL